MQQPDYSTKTIFHEKNDLVLFILSVMHGRLLYEYKM